MSDQYLEIISHYEAYEEANRLIEENPLEFLRTAEIIERSLIPSPGVIVDIGGGPGVYAAWLARLGHRVHLFDLVPRHVEAARTASDTGNLTAEVADARAIPMSDASADMVLLLGPRYHLVERHDRIEALCETKRILRPGGTVFAAGISRFASAIAGIVENLIADPIFTKIMERDPGRRRSPRSPARRPAPSRSRTWSARSEPAPAGCGQPPMNREARIFCHSPRIRLKPWKHNKLHLSLPPRDLPPSWFTTDR